MAKLVDPDSLNQATEVVISTGAKTIQLLVAGNLNDDSPGASSGVTLQCVYSFLKEEWKSDTALNKFKFPIKMYTKTDGQLINGWDWADAQTRQLIRDGGWTEIDGDKYAGIISLGNFDEDTDQAYYQQTAGYTGSGTNFDKTGNLNEAILIYNHTGPVDYTTYLKTFLRIEFKTYSSYNLLSEQGLTALEPVLYRLPLSNGTDLKYTVPEATIDADAPYTGMTVAYLSGVGFTEWANATVYPAKSVVQEKTGSPKRWFFTNAGGTSSGTDVDDDVGVVWVAYEGEEQIGTNYYAFNRIIDGNGGLALQIYNWAQRQLRKTSDINTGTITDPNQDAFGIVKGNLAADLLEYVGDTLKTKPGVLIRDFNINDRNNMRFFDITVGGGGLNSEGIPLTSTERQYPFVSAGTIYFSSNLVAETDADTKYAMYFTYILRKTGTDLAVANVSGSTADITSTVTDLSTFSANDYLKASGWTTAANNGIWKVTGAISSTSIGVTKQDSLSPVNEVAGDTVVLDENPFDSAGAIIVKDNSSVDITGTITAASRVFDFDYTNNVQGGRTGGTDAAVTVVAQGLPLAEWVSVESSITQTTGISITVTANDERNYANPA